jgi:hypothetical protein
VNTESKHLFENLLTRTPVRGVIKEDERAFAGSGEAGQRVPPDGRAEVSQMAIALFEDTESSHGGTGEETGADLGFELWPRPTLSLVPAYEPTQRGLGARLEDTFELEAAPVRELRPQLAFRQGVEVSQRRRARASARVRRRRTILVLATVGLLASLALPLSFLGGHPASGADTLPGAMAAGTGIVYVVQPGDTLQSIAAKVDPGDPGRLAAQLADQTGSAKVVPGEHLTLP